MLQFNELTHEQRIKVDEEIRKMIKLSCDLRGQIIENFSAFELLLEHSVAQYFTSCHPIKSQQLSFGMLCQEGFNFHNKRKAILFIAENAFPEFFKQNKKLNKEIELANSYRNLIAHLKLDISPDAALKFDGKNLTLISFTTKENAIKAVPKIINQEKINYEVRHIKMLYKKILQLKRLIEKS